MLFLGIPASNFSGIFGMVGTTENFQVLNNIVLGGIEIVKFSLSLPPPGPSPSYMKGICFFNLTGVRCGNVPLFYSFYIIL